MSTGNGVASIETGEIIAALTPEQAREITDRLRSALTDVGELVAEAWKGEAWAALERARSSLRQVLLAGDGLDTTSLRQAHFLFGELTFEQWVAFVGLHEQRHTAQMRALSARR